MPFEGPSFGAAEVLCGRPWLFAAYSLKNFIFAPPLRTFTMCQTQVSGEGVVYGNGICLRLSTFHPGAASTTLLLVMGTFSTYVYAVCHGFCGLYIVLHRGYVSLTTTALTGINSLCIRRLHLGRYLFRPVGFGILRSLFLWPYILQYYLRQICARDNPYLPCMPRVYHS